MQTQHCSQFLHTRQTIPAMLNSCHLTIYSMITPCGSWENRCDAPLQLLWKGAGYLWFQQLQRTCSSPNSFPNNVVLKMMESYHKMCELLLHLMQAPFPPTPNLYLPCTHRQPSVSSHAYQSAMEMSDMKLRGENRHWSFKFGWYFATLTNYPHFDDSCGSQIIHFWKRNLPRRKKLTNTTTQWHS